MRSLARILMPVPLLLSLTAAAQADCTCRAKGVVAEHGQTLCIRTPSGYQLARCDKVSNIASWTFLGSACPQIASGEPALPAPRTTRQPH